MFATPAKQERIKCARIGVAAHEMALQTFVDARCCDDIMALLRSLKCSDWGRAMPRPSEMTGICDLVKLYLTESARLCFSEVEMTDALAGLKHKGKRVLKEPIGMEARRAVTVLQRIFSRFRELRNPDKWAVIRKRANSHEFNVLSQIRDMIETSAVANQVLYSSVIQLTYRPRNESFGLRELF